MIKAIVFDMDGVLIDTERVSSECWVEVAEEMKLGKLEEGIKGCVGLNRNDAGILMRRLYGEDFPFEEFRNNVHNRMQQSFREKGIPLKPGVKEILEYLTKSGYIVGLASSTSSKSVMEQMEKTGLKQYFQIMITGDMVEHSKPEPDIYLKACKELGVLPEEAIAIEDSPNGIRSAYRAGMKPVMVPDLIEPTPEIEAMLYKKFDSLCEAQEYFTELTNEIKCY